MEEESIEAIEEAIADLKARWPAHSVPPHMWQQLEDLEEKLEAARNAREIEEGIFNTGQGPRLDNRDRIEKLRPHELLENLAGVRKGMTCVDLGSGTGTFALPMAEMVGSAGRVYAVDNSAEMLEHLRTKNMPPQLVPAERNVTQTGLESGIADVCLLAFILHEVNDPAVLIAEASRLLKPGGRLAILEWLAELDAPGPPAKKRISRERLENLFAPAGLSLSAYQGWTKYHYAAVGIKEPARPSKASP